MQADTFSWGLVEGVSGFNAEIGKGGVKLCGYLGVHDNTVVFQRQVDFLIYLVGDTWTDANVLHTCGVFVDIEIHLANHRYVVGNTHRHVEPEIVW